jgi:Domain of unknown function (DUF397)
MPEWNKSSSSNSFSNCVEVAVHDTATAASAAPVSSKRL